MALTEKKVNLFLILNLPAAWLMGVRIDKLKEEECSTRVTHRWINKNPFNSLYFAVQAMAAELSTGALVMSELQKREEKFSMLVTRNEALFTKKATGKILFHCQSGSVIKEALNRALGAGTSETFCLTSRGFDQHGDMVSEFHFQWSIKEKKKKP